MSKESVRQIANSSAIQEQFTKRGYDSSSIKTKIKKIKLPDRKDNTENTSVITEIDIQPHTSQYKKIIRNHWSILKTNKALEKTFPVESIITFRKNKNLKQLIGRNTIQNDKNIKISSNKYEEKCTPCKSGIRSLCCLQVQNTHSFRSK